jgi:hypothetical protein
MKAVRIALWSLIAVLVAIGIAIAALPVYLEAHKALLAGAASRAPGRAVGIEGAVGVAWLPRPSLVLEDIEIAGAEGSAAPGPRHAGRLGGDLDPDQLADWVPSGRPSGRGGFGVTVDSVRPVESTLVLQTASDPPRSFRIDRLDPTGLRSRTPCPSLDFAGEIGLSGIPVAISVSAGPAGEPGSAHWPFAERMLSPATFPDGFSPLTRHLS